MCSSLCNVIFSPFNIDFHLFGPFFHNSSQQVRGVSNILLNLPSVIKLLGELMIKNEYIYIY